MVTENLTDRIAQRCRALFLESKRSISDIAHSMGLTHSALINWKNGNTQPSLRSLELVAMEFDIPIEYFFTTDERAESILYGTPLRSENAEVNKLRDDLKSAWGEIESLKDDRNTARDEVESLQKQLSLMQVELDHYRNEQPKFESEEEAVNVARRSVEVSRSVLDAVLKLLDGVEEAKGWQF